MIRILSYLRVNLPQEVNLAGWALDLQIIGLVSTGFWSKNMQSVQKECPKNLEQFFDFQY